MIFSTLTSSPNEYFVLEKLNAVFVYKIVPLSRVNKFNKGLALSLRTGPMMRNDEN